MELEKDILRPLIVGEDVKRYMYMKSTDRLLLFPYAIENGKQRPLEEQELRKRFPLAYSYLLPFKNHLTGLKKKFKTNPKYWYALHRPRRQEWFRREKIITPQITLGCNMTLDSSGFFNNTKVYSLLKRESTNLDYRYFLAILNSKLMWFYLRNTGYVLRGGYFTFTMKYLEPLHIPIPDSSIEKTMISNVDTVLQLTREISSLNIGLRRYLFEELGLRGGNRNKQASRSSSFLAEIDKENPQLNERIRTKVHSTFKQYDTKLRELLPQLEELEQVLNHCVFKLYRITDEEANMIIQSYPFKDTSLSLSIET